MNKSINEETEYNLAFEPMRLSLEEIRYQNKKAQNPFTSLTQQPTKIDPPCFGCKYYSPSSDASNNEVYSCKKGFFTGKGDHPAIVECSFSQEDAVVSFNFKSNKKRNPPV